MSSSNPVRQAAGLVSVVVTLPVTVGIAGVRATGGFVGRQVGAAARRVAERVDLTPLVAQLVDLDALIAQVDLDQAAQRLDVDAVISRVDLADLVETVLAEIDLPEIIRSSSGSVASGTVRGLRLQSMLGDEAVTRAYDRLRSPRRRSRPTAVEPS